MIDSYQTQTTLLDICSTAVIERTVCEPLTPKVSTSSKRQVFETTAEDSAGLSWAIHTAYRAMSGDHKLPVLWYRGQRNKNWKTIPNIMRRVSSGDNRFVKELRNELRWARAKILPLGNDFTQADWLAFLQHNGFLTNVLDFSESLYPALFFAMLNAEGRCVHGGKIQPWQT